MHLVGDCWLSLCKTGSVERHIGKVIVALPPHGHRDPSASGGIQKTELSFVRPCDRLSLGRNVRHGPTLAFASTHLSVSDSGSAQAELPICSLMVRSRRYCRCAPASAPAMISAP